MIHIIPKASAAAMVPLQRRTFEETGGLRQSTPNYDIPKTPEGKRVKELLIEIVCCHSDVSFRLTFSRVIEGK
jgi:hypothetical protein